MAVNMILNLDLTVDDNPNDTDNDSGRAYLSSYICKGFKDERVSNNLDTKHLIERGSNYEWVPDVPEGFSHYAKHPIQVRPNDVEAITYEKRYFLATGRDIRSKFDIEVPVRSDVRLDLVAHLMVDETLSEDQKRKLQEGMEGFSQDPADDLQTYIVGFVAANVDVFGEGFSHETYLIDVGCVINKTNEHVDDQTARAILRHLTRSITLTAGNSGSTPSIDVIEIDPMSKRERIAAPTGPLYNDNEPSVEDDTWNTEGEPPTATLDELERKVDEFVDDYLRDEAQLMEQLRCSVVVSRKEKKKVATLISWPQVKVVWVRHTYRVGCVTVSIRLPKLKRRTAFKVLYVVLATHFDVEDWLFDLLLDCAITGAVTASVIGLISANPAVALSVFQSQFKECVWRKLSREVFACLSETLIIGTVHSSWKSV